MCGRFAVAVMTASSRDDTADAGEGVRSPERLTALSDGIYAIAMTLLVLTWLAAIPFGSRAGGSADSPTAPATPDPRDRARRQAELDVVR